MRQHLQVHDHRRLPKEECNRRLWVIYEMASAAAERAEGEADQTDDRDDKADRHLRSPIVVEGQPR